MFFGRTPRMIRADEALPGRSTPLIPSEPHHVNDTPITPPFPTGSQIAVVAEGCFWGVERIFWSIPGVLTTAVGYAGGFTPNPTYEEVCTGATGHAEAVMVVFDPTIVSYDELLRTFWESHDPTQGMRQGNDLGTQYRSAIFTLDDDQYNRAIDSRHAYEQALQSAGRGVITTTIEPLGTFADDWFYAEDYHQQYLSRNPYGYCGVKGTGVACPVPGPTI